MDMLARYLAEDDVPCPGCGYNLRGLTGDRCPECSQALELGVRLVEPRLGALIFGLVGMGMGTGFCVLVLAWGVSERGVRLSQLVPLMVGTGVGVLLLTTWILGRRRLTRRSPGMRWTLAAVMALASLVSPLWFIMTVR